ncbi:MAG: hypothetical protein HC912_10110 [Saprospiraceae bacterium]|nr:hypothetical protein [Saprospiraceae bacterium]
MKFLLLTLFITIVFTPLTHAQCISGDCQNGEGTYLLPSGAKYFGTFKNGEIHGFGTCKYPDGSKYEGEWENRLYEGYGTKMYADGTVRQGFWKKGLPMDETGKLAVEESLRETHKKRRHLTLKQAVYQGIAEMGMAYLLIQMEALTEAIFQWKSRRLGAI